MVGGEGLLRFQVNTRALYICVSPAVASRYVRACVLACLLALPCGIEGGKGSGIPHANLRVARVTTRSWVSLRRSAVVYILTGCSSRRDTHFAPEDRRD